MVFALGLSAVLAMAVLAEAMNVYAPSGRRWPVTTGMVLPMVTILDENGYYATLACTVSSFNDAAHTYNLACTNAPDVITVGTSK